MPISSLIVRSGEDTVDAVVQAIGQMPGASVVEVQGGAVAALTETDDKIQDKALWDRMEQLPGVVKVDLIYHNFEDVIREPVS